MRFATYNIHGCVGADARFDPRRIGEVLAALEADVIALQEVEASRFGGEDVLAYLAARTAMTPVAGATLRRGDADYGNALLTRLPVDSVERVDLSVRGCEPRGLIDARLRSGANRLRVIATHLGLRAAERRAQTSRLLSRLDRDPLPRTVLLGDFNEWWPWSDGLRRLRARLLPCRGAPTFPARLPLLALDRIWVERGWPDSAAAARARCARSAHARRASDHLPLWVDLPC